MAMDPDRFQMRDLKRRISKLEDQIGYLKTDLKRQTQRNNLLTRDLESLQTIVLRWNEFMPSGMVHIEGRSGSSDPLS